MTTAYRTKAFVPFTQPATLVVVPSLAQRQLRRRVSLVLTAWAPAHALLVVACGQAPGLNDPFLLVGFAFAALPCALHACAFRPYDENVSLTARLVPSPRACRLTWAAVLLVPVVGVVVYLATRLNRRLPEPNDVNPRGVVGVPSGRANR